MSGTTTGTGSREPRTTVIGGSEVRRESGARCEASCPTPPVNLLITPGTKVPAPSSGRTRRSRHRWPWQRYISLPRGKLSPRRYFRAQVALLGGLSSRTRHPSISSRGRITIVIISAKSRKAQARRLGLESDRGSRETPRAEPAILERGRRCAREPPRRSSRVPPRGWQHPLSGGARAARRPPG